MFRLHPNKVPQIYDPCIPKKKFFFWFFWTFFLLNCPSLHPQKGITKQQKVKEKGSKGQDHICIGQGPHNCKSTLTTVLKANHQKTWIGLVKSKITKIPKSPHKHTVSQQPVAKSQQTTDQPNSLIIQIVRRVVPLLRQWLFPQKMQHHQPHIFYCWEKWKWHV